MKRIITLLALSVITSSYAGPANSSMANPPPPAPDATAFCGQRPSKSIFGGFTSINRSINNGHTSITKDDIVDYDSPILEKFQGEYYWAINVTLAHGVAYPNSLYGKPASDAVHVSKARALVRYGTVVHWLYLPTHPERSSVPLR
jgi:hypothetical protein